MGDLEKLQPGGDPGEQDPDEIDDELAYLTQRCQAFEMQLKEWFDKLGTSQQSTHEEDSPRSDDSYFTHKLAGEEDPSSLFWYEPSTLYSQLPRDSEARVFPFFVCFPNPDIAYQLMLHWTGLLLMGISLRLAYSRLQPGNIGKLSSTNNPRSVALLLVQSLEYWVHPDMALLGTYVIGFPLSASQRFFQHAGTKEILWYDVIFQRLGQMKSGLTGFLDDMARRKTVKLVNPWHKTS